MSQWGQQQGFQYPMQTGYAGAVPQPPQGISFQQQNPPFQQQQGAQYQQNPSFQQGGMNNGGLIPQMTGMPTQRPQGFPSQAGGTGPAFLQSQPTGFPGANFQQPNRSIQHASAIPPVPQIPSQFQQYTSGNSFLNPSSQQQAPNRFLSPSPGLGQGLMPQSTGFPGRSTNQPLISQMTGFVDPRLQMMMNSFMPVNTAAPYNPAGLPQLVPQQNLQQSFQQHNVAQQGAPTQQFSWELTKAEKKKYNDLFRTWDSGNTGFIDGQTALEVFGVSGLPKDDLARIWTLADIDDRGKLNIAEFHIAMGLIFRRLNGMPIPDRLPPELVPPSARDLGSSVEVLKDILKHETGSRSRSPLGLDSQVSRLKSRTFNGSSSLESGRDATIYKHSDAEPPGGFYKPASRHIKRDDVRSRSEANSPAGDLSYIKKQLANTAHMLDQAAEAEASRTVEDEELDREMDDLKYRVKRMQDDLEYVSRGPKSVAKDEERRRLEREILSLMHERIPEVERRMKARDERRDKDRRQWARDRDRTNETFARFDSREEESYSSRFDERDRPYSRGYDEGRSFRGHTASPPVRDISPRAKSPAVSVSSPTLKDSPTVLVSKNISSPPPIRNSSSPAPLKNMTLEERQAYARAEAQRRIQARMAALGVTAPSSPSIDTTVEDRLQQEKKEAEEKARLAEKQAEERERLRKERLEQEKAVKEAKPVTPSPTAAAKLPVNSTVATSRDSAPAAVPRVAPPPPKPRVPPPPRPRKAPSLTVVSPAASSPVNEADPLENELRAREEAAQKQRDEQARRLRLLEEQEEAARLEEERYHARLEALKAKQSKPDVGATSDLSADKRPSPTIVEKKMESDKEKVLTSVVSPVIEKSTNPFSRLPKDGGSAPMKPVVSTSNVNPWTRPSVSSNATTPSINSGGNYQTAPSSNDGDWDDVKEVDDDSDSSDDEMRNSRDVRANIAQQLFGNMVPRSESASLDKSPSSPLRATSVGDLAPPPPPPPAPPQPQPSAVTASSKQETDFSTSSGPGNVGALMQSIQGGTKLRPTKTIDKSAPAVTGRVISEDANPSHISSTTTVQVPTGEEFYDSKSSNRQSVDWFSNRAADTGAPSTSPIVEKLPSTLEEEEEAIHSPEIPPEIRIYDVVQVDMKDDIDKSIEYRVRTLFAFESESPDDLSFDENIVLVANPSKSGSDWWYGTRVKDGKAGLFPKTYVQVAEPKKARAIFSYTANNADELSFSEGTELSILDSSEDEWWRAEDAGVSFVVPAAYLEIIEG